MKNFFQDNSNAEIDYDMVRQIITHNLNETKLDISFREHLRSLPEEVLQMQGLEELSFNCCRAFEEFPEHIGNLMSLVELMLVNAMQSNLPLHLGNMQQLRRINLSGQKYGINTNWEELATLKNIESIVLNNSLTRCKGALPEVLFRFPKLKFLYLSSNSLKTLPSRIAEWKELLILDISGNNFKDFPKELLLLPKLETLYINANTIDSMPEELFEMPALNELVVMGKDARRYKNVANFEKFFKQTRQRTCSAAYISFVLDVLRGEENIEHLEEAELLDLLDCGVENIYRKANAILEIRLRQKEGQKKLSKESVVVLKGDTAGKKGQLKDRLKSLGVTTATKVVKATTHVVVGINSGLAWTDLEAFPDLTVWTESMLLEALNEIEQPYLLYAEASTEAAAYIAHIQDLLDSRAEDSLLLAFELLRGGVFPKELLTDIFLIYKEMEQPKIKRQALSFINQYGPPEFGTEVKRRLPIFGYLVQSDTICENIMHYCNIGNLNRKKVVDRVYQKTKKGIAFALEHLSLEEKKDFFAPLIRDGFLDLSEQQLRQLPDDLWQLGKIKKLDISQNNFTELPEVLIKMADLEEIWLHSCVYLGQFPKKLLQSPSIKKIVIGQSWQLSTALKKTIELSGKELFRYDFLNKKLTQPIYY